MKNGYEILGDTTVLVVYNKGGRLDVLIDTADLCKLVRYPNTWAVAGNNYIKHTLTVDWKSTSTYLHRLIMDAPSHLVVDHINGNTLDNRKVNLRLITQAQNQQNKIKLESRNTSGYRGVSRNSERSGWRARLKLNGNEICVGHNFATPELAHEAIVKARIAYMPFSADARLAA